jgi:ABC-type bacteriocin/lantibiotic exporter with double-glycine peptidase domain
MFTFGWGGLSHGRKGVSSYRFLAPEVVQTSAMDCGPASLKCILEGFGVNVSYDRLREACQTDVDGSSIDTLEEVAIQLGLEAEQIIVPPEDVLLPEAKALPAIIVVRQPGGLAHFVVAWRAYGRLVQVMDPAVGRCWQSYRHFLDSLYIHKQPVEAGVWREWASSGELLDVLRRNLADLGLNSIAITALIAEALADSGWRSIAGLHAATRMTSALVRAGGSRRGDPAARMITSFFAQLRLADPNNTEALCRRYWPVSTLNPAPGSSEQVQLRGAVLVRVRGIQHREPTAASARRQAQSSPELMAALSEPPTRPGRELLNLLRADGVLGPMALAAALLGAAVGVIVEAVLFRGLLDAGRDLNLLSQRLAAMCALVFFSAALLMLELPIAGGILRLGRRLEACFRRTLFEKLALLDDRYFRSRLNSDMAQRSHEIYRLRLLPDLGGQLVRAGFELAATTAAIAWLDPHSAPLAIAETVLVLGLPLASQSLLSERDLRVRTHVGAMSRQYLDALLGLIPVRAHVAERAVRREHEHLLEEWRRAGLRLQRAAVWIDYLQSAAGFGIAACLLFAYLARAGVTGTVLLLSYWALSLPLLARQIVVGARQYPIYRNVTLRILEPLKAAEGSPAAEAPMPDTALDSQVASNGAHRGVAIAIEDVSVRASGHLILEGVNLTVAAGSQIGIVGQSAAGKSSLIGLLLGWHRPFRGRILIDGYELDGQRLECLREETAWVDPAIQLWNRPLLENLLYGATGDGLGSVRGSLEAAGLRELLQKLPNGLQTPLGEGGSLVSGGEGQRVRFGRAMSRPRARLVILDEPFSGLEKPLRRQLLEKARELWRGSTLICVTHDVSDTLNFEQVVVVEDGRIVENGVPADLARQPHSRYSAMLRGEAAVRAQFWSNYHWRRLRIEGGRLFEERPDAARARS